MNSAYDVAIIGGGTVGCMTFLDAVLRGFSCILLEKGEIGMQTNRASNGMWQAGMNYLYKDRGFVKINAADCELIARIAPDFLTRRRYSIPLFPGSNPYPVWLWDGYLDAYDALTLTIHGIKHKRFSQSQLREIEPNVRRDALGGVAFYEWVCDPVVLSRAFASAAEKLGGVIHEHTSVVSAEFFRSLDGKKEISSLTIQRENTTTETISAACIINAAGPWTPLVLEKVFGLTPFATRMTRGTSIIVRGAFTKEALVVFDLMGKYITIMPIGENATLIGPTNLDIVSSIVRNPDRLHPAEDEIEYLLSIASGHLVKAPTMEDIIEVRCGLRPQLYHPGVVPNNISHKFMIMDHEMHDCITNLLTIFGGKLSSQIRMAKEAVDAVCVKRRQIRRWKIPHIRLERGGLRIQPNHAPHAKIYDAQYALTNTDNIGKIALREKIKSSACLAPYIIKSRLRELFRRGESS